MTIQELFLIAVNADSKAERHNAFRQLREIATRGTGEEAEEPRYALEQSQQYLRRLAAA